MAPTRHHTPLPLPSAEHNLIRLEIHENKFAELNAQLANIRHQINAAEMQIVELCGRDGKGGAIGWLRQEQARSAEAQGARIGTLESHASDVDSGLKRIEVKQVDTRARMFAAAAVLVALASLAIGALKVVTGDG